MKIFTKKFREDPLWRQSPKMVWSPKSWRTIEICQCHYFLEINWAEKCQYCADSFCPIWWAWKRVWHWKVIKIQLVAYLWINFCLNETLSNLHHFTNKTLLRMQIIGGKCDLEMYVIFFKSIFFSTLKCYWRTNETWRKWKFRQWRISNELQR